jgi:hypothetical protein
MFSRRDIALLLAGAAIGVPAGMFSNYLYDWLFPKVLSVVSKQVGVQELIPVSGHLEFKKSEPQGSKSSYIEVRYAEGTDPRQYNCAVSVSEPKLFTRVNFSTDCRRVNFTIVDPRTIRSSEHSYSTQVFFEITIVPPAGVEWVGTDSIYVSYYDNL